MKSIRGALLDVACRPTTQCPRTKELNPRDAGPEPIPLSPGDAASTIMLACCPSDDEVCEDDSEHDGEGLHLQVKQATESSMFVESRLVALI